MNDLNKALELVQETTTLLNNRMKDFESRQEVSSIGRRMTNTELISPSRKLIKEGILTKINTNGKKEELIFILFNDMLCYAKGKKYNDKIKLQLQIPIDNHFYIENININNNNNKNKSDNDNNNQFGFQLRSSTKSFIVYAKSMNEKNEWIKELNKVIVEHKNKNKNVKKISHTKDVTEPLMVPDNWSDICQMKDCQTKFNLINRKYHCAYCGKLVCSKCCKNKLPDKSDKNKSVNVCKECYNSN